MRDRGRDGMVEGGERKEIDVQYIWEEDAWMEEILDGWVVARSNNRRTDGRTDRQTDHHSRC